MSCDDTTNNQRTRRYNDFANSKNQCLGKRDKSDAGRIDPRAVDICSVINEREEMFTTSSCSGRSFIYMGPGIKSTKRFSRVRISHDKIKDAKRYFDLRTLESDPTGGADPIRVESQDNFEPSDTSKEDLNVRNEELSEASSSEGDSIWLRFEPFILHVACRSLGAASALMAAARPAFKVLRE